MSSYDNQSIARGFKILECLADAVEPLSVSEVAARTGLHRATAHRLLNVLLDLGYVHKDQGNSSYTTGFYLHVFGYAPSVISRLAQRAQPFLLELAAQSGELVGFGSTEGIQMTYISVVGQGRNRQRLLQPEQRYDAHAKAIGKALMALKPPAEVRRYYEHHHMAAHTARTITSLERLLRTLAAARRDGFAFEDREIRDNWRAVAAPVLNPAGRAITAVSIEGPASRLKEADLPALAVAVKTTAQRLAHYLLRSCRPAQPRPRAAASQSMRQASRAD